MTEGKPTILTFLLCALLVDAAVETFLAGAPVRWWVVGTVATYLVLAAGISRFGGALRSRFGWLASTSAPMFVLLGLLALTAWMPEGLTHGVMLLGQPTSVVLSVASALAIGVAGVAIARVGFLPWWGRAALGCLAAYGALAFALGIAGHTAYPDLFHGQSFWVQLPRWVQGAVLGMLALVPGALFLYVIARMPAQDRPGSRHSALQKMTALGLTFLMGLSGATANVGQALMQPEVSSANDFRTPAGAPASSPEASVPQSAAAIATPFDVKSKAQELGSDVDTIFAFVRDHIGLQAYSGILRGARGALWSKAANSWDRSLLLAALLEEQHHKIRLVRGSLTAEQTSMLAARIWDADGTPHSTPVSIPTAFWTRLNERFQSDLSTLLWAADAKLPDPSAQALAPPAEQELVSHVWVQVSRGDSWMDLDSSFPDATPGRAYARIEDTMAKPPDGAFHRLRFRVRLETQQGQTVATDMVLEWEAPASELFGRDLIFGHQTGSANKGPLGLAAGISGEVSGTPTLIVEDHKPIVGKSFPLPRAQQGRPRGGGLSDLFSQQGSTSRELVAEWLEAELLGPGANAGPTISRTVFDRRGAAQRAAGVRGNLAPLPTLDGVPSALMAVHALTVAPGSFSVEELQVRSSDLLKSAAQLSAKGDATGWTMDNAFKTSAATLSWRALAQLGRLVMSRADEAEAAYHRPAVRGYPDTPRLCLTSLEFRGADKPDAMRVSLDLWRMSVRVEARGPDAARAAFRWRVARGVMESALERDAIASMHGGAPLAASSVLDAARAARIPISAASSGDEATFKAQSLSDDLRAVAREELKKGNVVIAPTGETTVGNTSGTAAFYSIDPRTGVTTSLGADGTHPSQEYVFQAAATLAFVGTVGFGLCGAFATADRISRCCWAFSVLSGAVLTLLVLPETLPILRGAGGATTATGAGVSGVMCMPDLPGTSPDQRRDREDRERRTGCAYPPRWC